MSDFDKAEMIRIATIVGGLILAGIVAIVLLKIMLRKARRKHPGPGTGFTLEQLREMLQQGQITKQEYQALRDALIHEGYL